LLCGAYRFDGDLCDALLASLPPVVHLPAGAAGPGLERALALLADEVAGDAPGQQAVLDRLLDLLLVLALRAHLDRPDAHAPAWYRALADPALAHALRLLHGEPARAWTVEGLAREVGLSRAALARRFTAALGVPPLQYLTSWRMELAGELLGEPGQGLAAVARAVGYGSEFAFSAAFKRERGVSPTVYRRARAAA
jgi:AraC-like DNA-binding protein